MNDSLSSPCNVLSGVPQGSVLGPLLFIIYINSIVNCALPLGDEGGLYLFADDMKVYSTRTNNLQVALDSICSWLKEKQLTLAPHKCTILSIRKPSLEAQMPPFFIEKMQITSSSIVKDLGVFISSDLKWSEHINYLYKSASLTSYQIFKTFKTTNIWTLLKLFTTYIRPKLE